jgi:hypothetical protein
MDTWTNDLHGRTVVDSYLIGQLPHSATGTEDIAIWRVKYELGTGNVRGTYRYVLNGSPWLQLNELLKAFDDNVAKRDRIWNAIDALLDAWKDEQASRDDSARLDY